MATFKVARAWTWKTWQQRLLHRFKWNAQKNGGKRTHQMWQRSNHPTALWSAKVIWEKIRYVHRNPVRAGWVLEAPHYLYSSALNYTGVDGLMPVTLYEGIVYGNLD